MTTAPPHIRPFIFQQWHAWQNTQGTVLLSDEENKTLREFAFLDTAINWLYHYGHKEAARALNQHAKDNHTEWKNS